MPSTMGGTKVSEECHVSWGTIIQCQYKISFQEVNVFKIWYYVDKPGNYPHLVAGFIGGL